jgi:hypothetical protein
MILMLLSLLVFVILIGIPAAFAWGLGWFRHPSEHMLGLIAGGSSLFLVFLAAIVAFAVVHVMTKDFVVPQMALENHCRGLAQAVAVAAGGEGWLRRVHRHEDRAGHWHRYCDNHYFLHCASGNTGSDRLPGESDDLDERKVGGAT